MFDIFQHVHQSKNDLHETDRIKVAFNFLRNTYTDVLQIPIVNYRTNLVPRTSGIPIDYCDHSIADFRTRSVYPNIASISEISDCGPDLFETNNKSIISSNFAARQLCIIDNTQNRPAERQRKKIGNNSPNRRQ